MCKFFQIICTPSSKRSKILRFYLSTEKKNIKNEDIRSEKLLLLIENKDKNLIVTFIWATHSTKNHLKKWVNRIHVLEHRIINVKMNLQFILNEPRDTLYVHIYRDNHYYHYLPKIQSASRLLCNNLRSFVVNSFNIHYKLHNQCNREKKILY